MIWEIDPVNSYIDFSVRHHVIAIGRGRFNLFRGRIEFDPQEPTRGWAEATIEMASLDTKNERRDADISSEPYLDVEHFPTMTFVTTSLERKGEDRFLVHGDLTLKRVTRPVTLDTAFGGVATDPQDRLRVGFSAETCLRRSDFDVRPGRPMQDGQPSQGEEINVTIEIQAMPAAAPSSE